jgi:RHS repeat-associated protein
VNQIKSLNRGSSSFVESWNYDGTGNWLQYNRTGSATENRTHNKANEIQTGVAHDRNGNMTLMPGLQGKYDAWNRLVEVRDSSNSLLATYHYNGLNQRVKKTVGGTVTTSVYNSNWQELESKAGNETTVYIWGKRYVDDLVLREKGAEKLYSLADPNWNVVAITNASGAVQERMKYDAFGNVSWMNASFTTIANSAYAWNRTYTGQVLDTETGLMLYRNRYYNTGLGRFVSRDPIGYDAGDANLMRYVGNRTAFYHDPYGLQTVYGPNHGHAVFGDGSVRSTNGMDPSVIHAISNPPRGEPSLDDNYSYPGGSSNFPITPIPQPQPQVPQKQEPPQPPMPNAAGCPEGWKMVPNPNNLAQANGCGSAGRGWLQSFVLSLGQTIAGDHLIFEGACRKHDLCWGNCSSSRRTCDDAFYRDMLSACFNRFPWGSEQPRCLKMAKYFAEGVSEGAYFGRADKAFNDARRNHCKCVPNCTE